MSDKPTVVLAGKASIRRRELMESFMTTDWNIVSCDMKAEPDRFMDLLMDADVVVGGGKFPQPVPNGSRLRLYHIPFTGYDWITPDDLPETVAFHNTHEHETTIAEHIMLGMLEFQIGLMRKSDPFMRQNSWGDRYMNPTATHFELRGATVGIVGYGHIGREVARRAKAFGMKVMAVSRTVRDEGDLVDWYGTTEELGKLCQESDFIVVAAPLDDTTRSMIDREQFELMREHAVIVNVGRGEVIDETALYRALSTNRIRGAVIDVWYRYPNGGDGGPRDGVMNPWPSRYPFHKLPNVIMSPHNSAWTEEMFTRRWGFVARQLDRFAKGEELENFCFRGTGSA